MMLNTHCRKLAALKPAFPYAQAQAFYKQLAKKTTWSAQGQMKSDSNSKNSVVSMPLHQFRTVYQKSLTAGSVVEKLSSRNFSASFAMPQYAEKTKHQEEKKLGQPVIVPQYWTGQMPSTVNPESFTIDCGGEAPELDEAFKARMQKAYDENQLVLLKNTGLSDLSKLKEYIQVCLMDDMKYEGGANSRG
jgi:hypothetical protein